MQWAIKVPGIPMPKGSIRPIIRDERVLMIPDTRHRKEFEAWKEALQVGGALIAQQLPAPLDEPVGVSIVFTLPAHKTRAWPYMKPSRAPGGGDLDKLVRVVLDELTTAGVLRDDSRVCRLRATKCYPGAEVRDALDQPGAIIRITPLQREDTLI